MTGTWAFLKSATEYSPLVRDKTGQKIRPTTINLVYSSTGLEKCYEPMFPQKRNYFTISNGNYWSLDLLQALPYTTTYRILGNSNIANNLSTTFLLEIKSNSLKE
ncbi:hypothetical protein RUM43_005608, partial [Polyplax serrata]